MIDVPGLLNVGTAVGALGSLGLNLLVGQIRGQGKYEALEHRVAGVEADVDTIYGTMMEAAVGDIYNRWRPSRQPDTELLRADSLAPGGRDEPHRGGRADCN